MIVKSVNSNTDEINNDNNDDGFDIVIMNNLLVLIL